MTVIDSSDLRISTIFYTIQLMLMPFLKLNAYFHARTLFAKYIKDTFAKMAIFSLILDYVLRNSLDRASLYNEFMSMRPIFSKYENVQLQKNYIFEKITKFRNWIQQIKISWVTVSCFKSSFLISVIVSCFQFPVLS